MSIAVPTLAIVLALLPGMLGWNAYFSDKFPKQLFGRSPLAELAHYVVIAIPLNALALFVFVATGNDQIAWEVWRVATTWGSSGERLLNHVVTVHGVGLTAAYLLFLFLALLLGVIFRRLVWHFRLDVRLPFLKPEHPWIYQLTGRLPGLPPPEELLPVAVVLADTPGENDGRLYRGVVDEVTVSRAGTIQDLTLRMVQRGKGRSDKFTWKNVQGDQLILIGSFIHSINMLYYGIAAESPSIWRRLKRWLNRRLGIGSVVETALP